MKRSELFLTALQLPIDFLMVVSAFLAAYYTRLNLGEVNPAAYWALADYLVFMFTLLPFWLIVFALTGLYTTKKTGRSWLELANIFVGVAGGTILVVAWPFLTRQEFFSRLVVIYLFFYAALFVAIGRIIIHSIREHLFRQGIGVHRLLVIGLNSIGEHFAHEIQSNQNLGLDVIGFVQTTAGSRDMVRTELPMLGHLPQLENIVKQFSIDDLLIADVDLSKGEVLDILEFAEDRKLGFRLAPSLLDVHGRNIAVDELAGIPILEYKQTPLDGWGMITKRLVDLVGSLIGIVIFGPLMLLTALAVKLSSRGPIIYNNERVGDEGNFTAYKFRSMKIEYCTGTDYAGATALKFEEQLIKHQNSRSGPIYKVKDDPRLTPIGGFIRKTSLDELPQLFNVLKGEMSLVGPRPHQPREVAKYQPHHRKLLHIKPGITGMAQISGRSDLDFEDEFRLDTYYIENWSLVLDLAILLKTPLSVLASRNRKAA